MYPITFLDTTQKTIYEYMLIILVGKGDDVLMKIISNDMFKIETIYSFITSRLDVTLFNYIY